MYHQDAACAFEGRQRIDGLRPRMHVLRPRRRRVILASEAPSHLHHLAFAVGVEAHNVGGTHRSGDDDFTRADGQRLGEGVDVIPRRQLSELTAHQLMPPRRPNRGRRMACRTLNGLKLPVPSPPAMATEVEAEGRAVVVAVEVTMGPIIVAVVRLRVAVIVGFVVVAVIAAAVARIVSVPVSAMAIVSSNRRCRRACIGRLRAVHA